MKKSWDWVLGLWNKLNTHAKWIIIIALSLIAYNWWIA